MRQTALTMLAGTALGAVVVFCVEWHRPPCATGEPRVGRYLPPDPGCDAIRHRLIVKDRLARRIIVERIALLEAAELFRAANGDDGLVALARGIPGHSIREKLCIQVINYVFSVENDMARDGEPLPSGPRWSAVLRAEFDRRRAAGEFPPEPGMY